MTHPTLRAAHPEDRDRILQLFQQVFGKERSAAEWSWAFLEGPVGPADIVIALEGDTVVAHAATLRRAAQIEGKTTLFGQSVDAMTHPDWQKQGLNQRLQETLGELHRAAGVDWVYGFSNEISTRLVTERQGRRSLGPFPLLARPLGAGFGALRRLGRSPETPVNHPANIPEDIDSLSHAAMAWHAVGVLRDRAYLEWRYRRPGGCYHAITQRAAGELQGFGVLAVRNQGPLRAAYVAEAIVREDSPHSWNQLTESLLERARHLRCDVIVALGTPGSRTRTAWRAAGLYGVPEWIQPENVAFSIRPTPSGSPLHSTVFDPASWHLCWGEHDLV